MCCVCLICLLAIAGAKIPIGQSTDTGEMNAPSVSAIAMRKINDIPASATSAMDVADVPTQSFGEMSAEELQDLLLYPGGMPFGIKFYSQGIQRL